MIAQHRYAQFARVRGFEPGSPDAPLMHEFISWIRSKWKEWAALQGRSSLLHLSPEDHKGFDLWLEGEWV